MTPTERDDIDADFEPLPLRVSVRAGITAGHSRRQIAAELGATLAQINEAAAAAVRDWSGERGTDRERWAALHWSLDDVHDRAVRDLQPGSGHEPAPLLQTLIAIGELRARLLVAEAATRPARPRTGGEQ